MRGCGALGNPCTADELVACSATHGRPEVECVDPLSLVPSAVVAFRRGARLPASGSLDKLCVAPLVSNGSESPLRLSAVASMCVAFSDLVRMIKPNR